MFKRNYELRCVEEFSRFRQALKEAAEPSDTGEPNHEAGSFDALPDEYELGITDSMMMYAGLSMSRAGEALGIEAPASLDQLHRRGELFLYTSLGSAALFAAAETSQQLF